MVTAFQQQTLKYHQREKRSWANPLLESMMTKKSILHRRKANHLSTSYIFILTL